ncbi:hypothetical protein AQUCO_01500089v1 [Aquilegia coerulea]|uniref:Uncharacterized protein n=1 Tax=Aquilegia coerulea TaxID=218851 RepID=A0A2G5DSB5_AQUCA|nr:hypothetical protein AQUCO_01500089v1 [Aquilegia coerulea]
MGRNKCSTTALKKGAWTEEEDTLLKRCIEKHGEGNWHKVPLRAGLNRCRKSCRLRWFNYLHPNIKRKWSLIAARLPGRTANDIKNRWNTHIYKSIQKKQVIMKQQSADTETTTTLKIKPIKPQPRTFSKMKTSNNSIEKNPTQCGDELHEKSMSEFEKEQSIKWWESLLLDEEDDKVTNSSSSGSKDDFAFDSFPFDGIVPNNEMGMCLDLNLWES